MEQNLRDFVRNSRPGRFRSEPFYSKNGDFLTLFFENTEFYAHRVDAALTVYLKRDNKDLVGFKIKGVRRILKTLKVTGRFDLTRHVPVGEGEVELQVRILLVPGKALASNREQDEWYESIEQEAGDIRFDAREALACAGS